VKDGTREVLSGGETAQIAVPMTDYGNLPGTVVHHPSEHYQVEMIHYKDILSCCTQNGCTSRAVHAYYKQSPSGGGLLA